MHGNQKIPFEMTLSHDELEELIRKEQAYIEYAESRGDKRITNEVSKGLRDSTTTHTRGSESVPCGGKDSSSKNSRRDDDLRRWQQHY